ncbi:glycosyltransferase [Rhizobium leguminosarum]|uniref:glycosyltransferase n=1 Tax=Rhizobium leguminosarum TaxID=384 RepID=UPI001C9202B6|nr:hypothetical protein [Rhizobium leguminosarum]MBY2989337.1 glycosyltransferase [Rhizobium leguminosarum]
MTVIEERFRYEGGSQHDRGWARILSVVPTIIYTAFDHGQPLGFAGAVGNEFSTHPITFVMAFRWNIESREMADWIRQRVAIYRNKNPLHRFIFTCNSYDEYNLALEVGLEAELINHNMTCDLGLIYPLPGPRLFDAIYNARLVGWKRHDLTTALSSCAFIFYRPDYMDGDQIYDEEAEIISRHKQLPGHVFLNRWTPEGPVRMDYSEVNFALNSAHVGLCLSSSEGAMQASIEYLLRGMPVVSTPSRGGRDWYFSDDFCLTCEPDPSAIASAVEHLKKKAIPPEYIRATTLAKIEADRDKFKSVVNDIALSVGQPRLIGRDWPYERKIMRKGLWANFAEELKGGLDALVPN